MENKLDELGKALAKAQGQIEAAKKDANNPFFKSKYADLASVWDACRDALSSNGLSIIQMPRSSGDEVFVETILLHESGQSLRDTLALKMPRSAKKDRQGNYLKNEQGELILDDITPQMIGSAITYARRYALSAFVGIAPEDDDGNASSRKSVAAATISGAMLANLDKLLKASTWTQEKLDNALMSKWGYRSARQMTINQYNQVVEALTMAVKPTVADLKESGEIKKGSEI